MVSHRPPERDAHGDVPPFPVDAETAAWLLRTGLAKPTKLATTPKSAIHRRVLRCVAGWLLDLSCWLMSVAARGRRP
jgi:hypothetical protein